MKTADPKGLAKLHSPLYRVIEQDLRGRIHSGKWTAGAMLPSRQSLAKEYGVDMRTIQRAICDLLADGTLHAHGGRGTFVAMSDDNDDDTTAVANKAVMVIAEQSFSPVPSWPVLIHAIHEGLRKQIEGCRILTFNTTDKTHEGVIRHEQDALRMVETEGYSGVIMFHCGGESTLPDIQRVLSTDVPIVFIDRLPFEHGCNFVGIDNRFAAREAIEYLLSIGHTRIAFIAPKEKVSTIDDRLHGYLDAFMSVGIPPPNDLIFRLDLAKSFSREGLRSELGRVISEFMELPEPPTAVFVVNDFMAEYLVLALEDKGLDVPNSLSIIGFDDVESFLPQKPKLTTIKQPFQAIGERAASMLCWRMSNPVGPTGTYQHVMLPASLVVRESTQAIAT